ncbi:MAG: hypothetical protein AB1585_14545 [Thermodesulfobacteriota bacterium]
MSIVKQIVCLANSRKSGGFCFAGKVLKREKPVKWIRPVSSRENEEVSSKEYQYEDGTVPQLLDIINVPLLEPKPTGCQKENWLFDPDFYWRKIGFVTKPDLNQFVDPVDHLWINGYKTYNGFNDMIPLELVDTLESSLRFIHVDHLNLYVYRPGEDFGDPRKRLQGNFKYNKTTYRLWVTDPLYEKRYLSKPEGEYEIGESFLTISVGSFKKRDEFYKLIAAIISLE